MPAGDDARKRTLTEFAARAAKPTLSEIVDASAGEVADQLERAGVPFLLLKGAALARLLYRPDESRPYLDVDVLVPPDFRERAGATLAGLGYLNLTEQTGVDEFTGVIHAETWHSKTLMPVDLHWRLSGCEAPPEQAWARLFDGRQTIEVAGRTVSVPGRPGLALHLATHAAQHGPDDQKTMGDLDRGIERWPLADWQAATLLAEALEATAAFAAGLRLHPKGAQLAEALELPQSAELEWEILNRRGRPRGTFHIQALESAGGIGATLHILRRSLLPSRAWIAREFPWAAGSALRVAAGYAAHVIRVPVWALRVWRYRRQARRATSRQAG